MVDKDPVVQAVMQLVENNCDLTNEYEKGVDCIVCGAKPKNEPYAEYVVHLESMRDPNGEVVKWVEGKSPICPRCYELLRTGLIYSGTGRVGRYLDNKEYVVPTNNEEE